MSEVADADIIVLTKDIAIQQEERFNGKKIVRIAVADAVKKAPQIMDKIEAHLASI
ncbi:PTS system fructose-like IIB component 1 precursor [Photobacterium aphoticum]|nr:PTS system fructose-like IIB component 1 precursor [Photobacterium aphoticum]